MKICYYITSHGFGHATRSFAIIKELINRNINVTIRADFPDWLVNNSFKDTKLSYQRNFETLQVHHNPKTLEFQEARTIQTLKKYCGNYKKIIKQDIQFCEKNDFDLIISDMEPTAFEIGEEVGIDSIAITNFTWIDIFKQIIPTKPHILNIFKNAYNKAAMCFRFPFHFEMDYFKKTIDVPLVFRKLTRSKEQVQSHYGLKPEENVILIQFGGTRFNPLEKWERKLSKFFKRNSNVQLFMFPSSRADIPNSINSNITITPYEDSESQDYLAISDLIIGKVGYSSVSEVVGYNIPFFYCMREAWPENIPLKEGLENYGISKHFSRLELIEGSWIDNILDGFQMKNHMPKLDIKKYGQDTIVDYILENY